MSARRKRVQEDELTMNRENELLQREIALLKREKELLEVGQATPSFNDFIDTLVPFTGDDEYSIRKFIKSFEETKDLMKWSPLQQLVFAKKLLKGTAALFLRGENGLNSWPLLRDSLLKEFDRPFSASDLHRKLAVTKKHDGENYRQYLLRLKEIAALGDVDDISLIDYVIRGIKDDEHHKSILYGATNLDEFKLKLDVYSKIKHNSNTQIKYRTKADVKFSGETQPTGYSNKINRCFNCGSMGHISTNCQHKGKGTKCFSYGMFGHISSQCERGHQSNRSQNQWRNRFTNIVATSQGQSSNEDYQTNVVGSQEKQVSIVNSHNNEVTYEELKIEEYYNKQCENINRLPIKIENNQFIAIIDTGSDVNLITESGFNHLNIPVKKIENNIKLRGLGGDIFKVLGKVDLKIQIQGNTFNSSFCIVEDGLFGDCSVLIGNDLLSKCELIIRGNLIRINKMDNSPDTIDCDIFKIDVNPDISDLEVGKVEYHEVIKNMKDNYKADDEGGEENKDEEEKEDDDAKAEDEEDEDDANKDDEEEDEVEQKPKGGAKKAPKRKKDSGESEEGSDEEEEDEVEQKPKRGTKKTSKRKKDSEDSEEGSDQQKESDEEYSPSKKKDLATRVARWALLLEEFNYLIEHRPGVRMKNCDALSRNPIILMIENEFLARLTVCQREDEELTAIMKVLKTRSYKDCVVENGLLYKKPEDNNSKLLIIPRKMRNEIIRTTHGNGHFGVKKTSELLGDYYIKNLNCKIESVIKNCVACILAERKRGKMQRINIHPRRMIVRSGREYVGLMKDRKCHNRQVEVEF